MNPFYWWFSVSFFFPLIPSPGSSSNPRTCPAQRTAQSLHCRLKILTALRLPPARTPACPRGSSVPAKGSGENAERPRREKGLPAFCSLSPSWAAAAPRVVYCRAVNPGLSVPWEPRSTRAGPGPCLPGAEQDGDAERQGGWGLVGKPGSPSERL